MSPVDMSRQPVGRKLTDNPWLFSERRDVGCIFQSSFKLPYIGRVAAFFLLALFFSLPAAAGQAADEYNPDVWEGYYWVQGDNGIWRTNKSFIDINPLTSDSIIANNLVTPKNWVKLWYGTMPSNIMDLMLGPDYWYSGYYEENKKDPNRGVSAIFARVPVGGYNTRPGRTDVALDGFALVKSMLVDGESGNWLFTSTTGVANYGIVASTSKLYGELWVGNSNPLNARTVTFHGVDLSNFRLLTTHQNIILKFEHSSLDATSIYLFDNSTLIWDRGSGAGSGPVLKAPSIFGYKDTVLDLRNLTDGSLTTTMITGLDSPMTVRMGGNGSQTIGSIGNAHLFVDGGALVLNGTMLKDVFLSLGKGASLDLNGYYNRLTGFDGAGTLRVGSSNSLSLTAAPGSPPSSFAFTGSIDLHGGQLTVDSYQTLGQPDRIYSSTPKPSNLTINFPVNGYLHTILDFPGSSLTLDLSGKPLTIALPVGQSSQGTSLLKTGNAGLVLDGGRYNFNSITMDNGMLTLTGGVSLATGGLYAYVPLRVSGPASLKGELRVYGTTLTLEDALTVTGNAVIGGAGALSDSLFDYRGGRLSVTGGLQLGDSAFSADLLHPGIFVVADYGNMLSRFANAPLDSQDVSSLVRIGEFQSTPAWLTYTANNQIVLAAPGGYNLLYRTGAAGDGWRDGGPHWQDLAHLPRTWQNGQSHIAVFGGIGIAPYHVEVTGFVEANMLSFLDGGWSIGALGAGELLLKPFMAAPSSPLHFAVLNSQVVDPLAAAPRLELPVLVVDPLSVPLWKTGAGDLILAADASHHGNCPKQVFIKDGRLILEHNGALGSALITLDPGSALALDWKTMGTGNDLLNVLAGAGRLEVRANTGIRGDNPDFAGLVTVDDSKKLTLSSLGALGQAPGLPHIELLGPNAVLGLAYNSGGATTIAPLSRTISGAGSVSIEANQVIRLAAGSNYTGGTDIGSGATLILGGAGMGREFTAAGSRDIRFDNADATLRLENGGLLPNQLIGNNNAALQLAGPRIYILEEDAPGQIQGQFTGMATMEQRFTELVLKVDSALAGGITPTFGINGQGNLILEGPNRTFDFRGLSRNTYTGGTALADQTTLILDNDYTTGQIGSGQILLLGADSVLQLTMGGATNTFANALAGTGWLELSAASYRLTGDNILFSGQIVIPGTLEIYEQRETGQARLILENGAVLSIQGAQVPSLANGIELKAGNGILDVGRDLRLNGFITGSGGLNKTGAGILTLPNPDYAYSGSTQVNAGELRLEDARLSGGGAVTVGGGAALSGRGGILGHTYIANGGTLSVDGFLSFYGEWDQDGNLIGGTDLSLDAGGNLVFNNGGSLDVSGALDWGLTSGAKATTINLDSLGIYVLAQYGTTNLAGGEMNKADYTVNYNGGQIESDVLYHVKLDNIAGVKDLVLIAMPNGQKLEFWAKNNGGLWNVNGETSWSSEYLASPGTMEAWSQNSLVAVFGAESVTPGQVRLTGPIAASGIFFLSDGWYLSGGSLELLDLDPHDTNNYAVIGGQGSARINSVLSGSSGLHKSGSGTIALGAANTYTGGTLISAGTLRLNNRLAAGSGDIQIEPAGMLHLGYQDLSRGFPNAIKGEGRLQISGQILLDRDNSGFDGEAQVWGGVLRLTHNQALGNASLRLVHGTLQLGGGLNLGNTVELLGIYNNLEVADGESAEISGKLVGTGNFAKTGAGRLVLTNDNSDHIGVNSIMEGTLVVGNDMALGKGKVNIYDKTVLTFFGPRTLANDFTLYGEAFIDVAAGNNSTISGNIGGTGALTKIGDGTLTLDSLNNYTGPTTVQQGSLALGQNAGISSSLRLYQGTTFNDNAGNNIRLGELEVRFEPGSSFDPANYLGNLNTSGGQMNFFLPSTAVLGGLTMLNVTGTANIADSLVGLNLGGRDLNDLRPGKKLTLIHSDGLLSGNPINTDLTGRFGITLNWTAGLTQDDHNLYASVLGVRASPESKALAEGFLAGLSLLNQSADLAAGKGIPNAVSAVEDTEAGHGLAGFGVVSGGWSRYNTGSHTDVSSLSLMTGLAWGRDRLTLGSFLEYGNGSYDTYNSFANAASVKGDGNTHYLGGGVIGRMDFRGTGASSFYAETVGRAGGIRNKYRNGYLRDPFGLSASYDTSSAYYGAYAGLGYIRNFTAAASLELHAKYFWTRQNGGSVTLAAGDPVSFAAADSHRLRGGARFSYAVNDHVIPYAGVAYEHEFDGRAKATTYGYSIDKPSLGGGTGIGELGLMVKPRTARPLTIDLGVQGYIGKREGMSGSMRVRWSF